MVKLEMTNSFSEVFIFQKNTPLQGILPTEYSVTDCISENEQAMIEVAAQKLFVFH